MDKGNNSYLFMAAGVTLAVIALATSDKSKPAPTYVPPITAGGPIDFIRTHYPDAIRASKLFPKVPWQLFLSFSGLESAWGKSAPQYNFYGTKPGKGYTGKTQLITTHEILPKKTGYKFPEVISIVDSTKYPGKYDWKVKDYFRAYNSAFEAFLDFGAFVSKGCYKTKLDAPTIHLKLQGIKDCGYATDPGYVAKQDKLVKLIEEVVVKYGVKS